MDRLERLLDVHARVGREIQLKFAAAAERLRAECGSEFRDQDGERGRGGRRRGVGPQRVDELVAGQGAFTVEREVGEQKPSLATRKLAVDPLAVKLDEEPTAELDPWAIGGWQGDFFSTFLQGWCQDMRNDRLPQSLREEHVQADQMRVRVHCPGRD